MILYVIILPQLLLWYIVDLAACLLCNDVCVAWWCYYVGIVLLRCVCVTTMLGFGLGLIVVICVCDGWMLLCLLVIWFVMFACGCGSCLG